jgi:hypothetical protein
MGPFPPPAPTDPGEVGAAEKAYDAELAAFIRRRQEPLYRTILAGLGRGPLCKDSLRLARRLTAQALEREVRDFHRSLIEAERTQGGGYP